MIGARSRVARRIPFERERDFERAASEAIPFKTVRRRLTPAENFAYDRLARYGWATPDERARTLELVDQEIAFRRERLRGRALPGREDGGSGSSSSSSAPGRRQIANPSDRLMRALEEGSKLQARSQETKIETRQLTPEAAGQRVNLPARIVSGATAERTPSGRPGWSTFGSTSVASAGGAARTEEEARARLTELDASTRRSSGGSSGS